jgi:hypothetical protein
LKFMGNQQSTLVFQGLKLSRIWERGHIFGSTNKVLKEYFKFSYVKLSKSSLIMNNRTIGMMYNTQLKRHNQKQLFSCSIWDYGNFLQTHLVLKRGLRMPQMCGIWAFLDLI